MDRSKVCWLSPEGKIYPCVILFEEAYRLVKLLYNESSMDPEYYLEKKGWIKYYVDTIRAGWIVHNHCHTPYNIPTQAQIDSAFDWTGDNIAKRGQDSLSPFLYGIWMENIYCNYCAGGTLLRQPSDKHLKTSPPATVIVPGLFY